MSNILEYNHYENMFKAEFKRLIGRYPNSAELREMENKRGIYTIRELVDMIGNSLMFECRVRK